MSKKAALFDTEEFDIKKELKTDPIDVKQPEVRAQENKQPEKPKYIRLDLKGNNHAYVSFMADMIGESMTQYINDLIEADKDRNTDSYNKFLEIERIKNNII